VHRPGARRAAALVLALTLVLTAAGCGSGDDGGGAAAPEAGASYPVTIRHKLGEAVIERKPERIVALWDADIDAVLALGAKPVGISASSSDEGGVTPWATPKLPDPKPALIPVGDSGVNIEQVAALRPDLILAGSDYYIDKEYDKLAKIAPTTAYETSLYGDSWQTTLRQVGKALGMSDRAEQLVTEVEGKVGGVKTDHPELVGKAFAITNTWQAGSMGVLRSKDDSGVKMLNDFGMELAPSVASLEGEEYAAQISLERLEVLDTDVLLGYYAQDDLKKAIEANRLFAGLDVVKRGSYMPLTLQQFSALRTPTVLSVPYFIEQVVPGIAKAAAADGS
jgi:iron complex transport system substrate-binding protein